MVFGRRSGPVESRVQGIDAATGELVARRKPPSFESSAVVLPAGQTTSTVTCGSLVKRAPPLIDTPTGPAGGTGAVSAGAGLGGAPEPGDVLGGAPGFGAGFTSLVMNSA